MRPLALSVALLLLLPACDGSAFAENMHEQMHRVVPAGGIRRVRLKNVSGTVVVNGGSNRITVDATKNGSSESALARTHVDIRTAGDELVIKTSYDRNETWFGRGGASVNYRITLPAGVALDVTNVSGSISIGGISGDVHAADVSGSVHASLGRVAGSRTVKLGAVSGSVEAQIAKNSDVTISASTVSGGISPFAGGSVHKGYAGADAHGRLGSGSASMNLSTVSGSITVSPQ